jgi:hypothetical protein
MSSKEKRRRLFKHRASGLSRFAVHIKTGFRGSQEQVMAMVGLGKPTVGLATKARYQSLKAERSKGAYEFIKRMVPVVGFELTTYRLQGGCSTN